jgi:hypothetical protein
MALSLHAEVSLKKVRTVSLDSNLLQLIIGHVRMKDRLLMTLFDQPVRILSHDVM